MNQRPKLCAARQLALTHLAVSLVLLASCSPQPAFKGSWTGTVRQPGYPPYSVEMTVTAAKPGEPAGSVTYPELNCSGTLRCEAVNGTSTTFRESILSNRDGRCVDGVKIVLTVETPLSTTAAIAYFMPDGNPGGTAELTRIDAR